MEGERGREVKGRGEELTILLSPAEIRLYLLVLEEQGRHKRILEVVTGELGRWAGSLVQQCCGCGIYVYTYVCMYAR